MFFACLFNVGAVACRPSVRVVLVWIYVQFIRLDLSFDFVACWEFVVSRVWVGFVIVLVDVA